MSPKQEKVVFPSIVLHAITLTAEIEVRRIRLQGQRNRCIKRLRPPNMTAVHQQQLGFRMNGTCEWIQSNQEFLDWKTTQLSSVTERVLTISGTHGCGKSVLASAIAQSLEVDGHCCAFFAFSSSDAERQTADSLVRSLIAHHLQRADEQIFDAFCGSLEAGQQSTTTQLWGLLVELRKEDPEPTFYVLDGLDEATDEPGHIINQLLDTLGHCSNSKCVLLGRPQAFRSSPGAFTDHRRYIRMDRTCTGPDIEAFVDAEIRTTAIIKSTGLDKFVSDALKGNTQDMFLWAKLMIDDLRTSWSAGDVLEKLRNPPHGLDEAYGRVLARIQEKLHQNEARLLQNILKFVISARRPLTPDELAWAHALQVKSTLPDENTSVRDYLLCDPEKAIQQVGGELINIYNGRVNLNHASIREFLIRDVAEWNHDSTNRLKHFRVDLSQANDLFAGVCFDYLDMKEHGFPMRQPESLLTLRKLHPFMEYASYSFVFHAMEAPVHFPSYSERLKDFCSSLRLISWFDHSIYAWNDEEFELSIFERLFEFLERCDGATDTGKGVIECLITRLRLEMEHRISLFGPDDPRTAYFRLCVGWFELEQTNGQWELPSFGEQIPGTITSEALLPFAGNHMTGTRQEQQDVLVQTSRSVRTTATGDDIIQTLRTADIIKSPHQIVVVTKLLSHIMKLPLDPLLMVYRFILHRAAAVPVYALLALCGFYFKLEKYNQCVEICRQILPRVDGSGKSTETLTYEIMGHSYSRMKQYENAITFLRQAIGRRELFPVENRDFLESAYISAGLYGEGLSAFEEILSEDRKKYGDKHHYPLRDEYIISKILNRLGKDDDALERCRHVVAIADKSQGLRATSTNLWALVSIGIHLHNLGREQEAIVWLESHYTDTRFDLHMKIKAYAHFALGIAYYADRSANERALDPAIHHLRQGISIRKEFLGRADEEVCLYLCYLGRALMAAGRYDELLQNARCCLDASSRCCGTDHNHTRQASVQLAVALDSLSRHEEARELRRKTSAEIVNNKCTKEACHSLRALSEEARKLGAVDEAIEWLKGAVELESAHFHALDKPFKMRNSLYFLLGEHGRYEDALKVQKGTARSARVHFGSKHWHTVKARFWLGESFYELGHNVESRGCLADVQRIIKGTSLDSTLFGFDVRIVQAGALWGLGEFKECLTIVTEALDSYDGREASGGSGSGWTSKTLELAQWLRENTVQ